MKDSDYKSTILVAWNFRSSRGEQKSHNACGEFSHPEDWILERNDNLVSMCHVRIGGFSAFHSEGSGVDTDRFRADNLELFNGPRSRRMIVSRIVTSA